MYKKLSTIALTGALAFSLTACGSNEKNQNEVSAKEKEQPKQEIKKDNSKEEKVEVTKDNLSNPIEFNKVATIEDIILVNEDNHYGFRRFKTKAEVSIAEVIRGKQAYEILKQESEKYNDTLEPAPKGMEWVLVKIKSKVLDSETEEFGYLLSDINFELVSKEGQEYNHEKSATTRVPDSLSLQLKKGTEGEGYISRLVNTDDDFMVRLTTRKLDKVFFKSK